jgi:hypothetical protein
MPSSQPVILGDVSVVSTESDWYPGERLQIRGVKMVVVAVGEEPVPCLELMAPDGNTDFIPLPEIPGYDYLLYIPTASAS